MAIEILPAFERGSSDHGWLHSRFSFSFGDYYDPQRMAFGALRVLNDDIIEAGHGFDMHPHANFEIVTIVLEGELEHKDSMGNKEIVKVGEVQRMSAGSGITHSEFNPSKTARTKLLQIWVKPKKLNIKPNYGQKKLPAEKMRNKLFEVAGGSLKGEMKMNQDARFLLADLEAKKSVSHAIKGAGLGVYVFVIEGSVEANGAGLGERDAAQITGEKKVEITAKGKSKVLLIEVPMA